MLRNTTSPDLNHLVVSTDHECNPLERRFPMSISSAPSQARTIEPVRMPANPRRNLPSPIPFQYPAHGMAADSQNRHAELFYLQKQIQSQTPMVIVLEDGERIEGCIEWYDRNALKIRGRTKMLVYKSSIKYMYKLGDNG
jgi:sRNA-binding regulator protein Hfq